MIAISVVTFFSLDWLPLDLLPVFLLIQPRTWLAFIPAAAHQNLFGRDAFSACPATWGCFLPAAGLFICPYRNSGFFCQLISPACLWLSPSSLRVPGPRLYIVPFLRVAKCSEHLPGEEQTLL